MSATQFAHIKYLKVNWLKNCTANGGAMQQVIDNNVAGLPVVHSHTQMKGRLWGVCPEAGLVKLTNKNRGIFEVITSYPHKVYFDVDCDGKDESVLDACKATIMKHFKDADMAISGSIDDDKTSYHIILNNYTIKNSAERECVKFLVKSFGYPFDWKVYTNNRNMKCINQKKPHKNRTQLPITYKSKPEKHFITSFIPKSTLPLPFKKQDMNPLTKKYKSNFSITDYKSQKLNVPSGFDHDNLDAMMLLNMAPLDSTFDHAYTHRIARFAYYNNLSFTQFWKWNSKKNASADRLHKWMTLWDNLGSFPRVSVSSMMMILSRFYPMIFRDRRFQLFEKLMIIDEDKKISKLSFKSKVKSIIANLPMGFGKTKDTIKYLQSCDSFIWVTPRRSLARNTYNRLESNGVECLNYLSLTSKHQKQRKIPQANKLIINTESLHYTDLAKYDVVVIDEIETVLNSWISFTTHGDNIQANWKRFKSIITHAKKVILLDAFTSNKTIRLIDSITKVPNRIVYGSKKPPPSRTMKLMNSNNLYTWIDAIVKDLNKGMKLFIFYPYKRQGEKYPSIEGLTALIKSQLKGKNKGKNILTYHADNDGIVNKTLEDVNTHWNDCCAVVTNSKITVGINFDRIGFDKAYLSLACFSSPRDVIQSSYRARNLNANEVTAIILSDYSIPFTDESYRINCPIYKQLCKDIYVEKKAPIVEAFKLMCSLAGYKFTEIPAHIDKSTMNVYIKYWKTNDVTFMYEKLPTLLTTQVDAVKQRIFTGVGTMDDVLAVRKFYFSTLFAADTPDEVKQYLWNNKLDAFAEQYMLLKKKANRMFDILDDLNITDMKLSNITNIKLTPKQRETICRYVVQRKDISMKKSSDCKVLSLLFKSYFAFDCLKYKPPKCKKSNNGKWIVNPDYLTVIEKCKYLDKDIQIPPGGFISDTSGGAAGWHTF